MLGKISQFLASQNLFWSCFTPHFVKAKPCTNLPLFVLNMCHIQVPDMYSATLLCPSISPYRDIGREAKFSTKCDDTHRIYIHIHVYIHIYVYAHVHIHIHIHYIYTYMYMYTYDCTMCLSVNMLLFQNAPEPLPEYMVGLLGTRPADGQGALYADFLTFWQSLDPQDYPGAGQSFSVSNTMPTSHFTYVLSPLCCLKSTHSVRIVSYCVLHSCISPVDVYVMCLLSFRQTQPSWQMESLRLLLQPGICMLIALIQQ